LSFAPIQPTRIPMGIEPISYSSDQSITATAMRPIR
jgi:hypothetical protein